MVRTFLLLSVFCLSSLLLTGCGQEAGTRQAISGEVKFKGQPLDQGMIQFTPKPGSKGSFAGAEIKNGSYEIPAVGGLDAGTYEVRVTSPEGQAAEVTEAPGEAGAVAKERIPPDYNANTKLEFTATGGEPAVFNIDIP